MLNYTELAKLSQSWSSGESEQQARKDLRDVNKSRVTALTELQSSLAAVGDLATRTTVCALHRSEPHGMKGQKEASSGKNPCDRSLEFAKWQRQKSVRQKSLCFHETEMELCNAKCHVWWNLGTAHNA